MRDLHEKEHQLFLTEHRMSGYDLIDTFPSFEDWNKTITPEVQTCECGGFMELLPSLTSMQPDSMWSGKNTDYGYFTSKKEFNKFQKDNNLVRAERGTFEQVQKKSKNRISDHIKKTAKAKEKAIADVIKQIDLPND